MPKTRAASRATDADRDLALRIGQRLREARARAGLTQQQLAGDRYTKAYVSALETGVARPSMVALRYIAGRLGLPASYFIDQSNPAWSRLEVDMRLAAGDWQAAADGYRQLLEDAPDDASRADTLRGLSEALNRLNQGSDAIAPAAEAARLYERAGRRPEAALARYWVAYAQYQADNEPEARRLLGLLLDEVRGGLQVEPDFEMRILTALAAVESRAGAPARALTYLEEARGIAADLDDWRRATFLFNLAISYREVGDFEAAIRTGTQAVALFRAAGAVLESAQVENDLALAYLALGQISKARDVSHEALRQIEPTGDDRWLAAVIDTEAQIALADGDIAAAIDLAHRAADHATRSGNELSRLDALRTEARALRASGAGESAAARLAEAADIARRGRVPHRLREILGEWADLKAEAGDHRGAYELTAEALAVK